MLTRSAPWRTATIREEGWEPFRSPPSRRNASLRRSRRIRRTHRPVIVDTAGFRNRTTICALVASDLAIIPLKPSAEDVDAALATYELITEINTTPEREGRPITVVMVLTMGMQGTVITRHVRAQLEGEGYPLLKAEMTNRVAYPETGIEGLSPPIVDPDGAAARDIAVIAQEMLKFDISKNQKGKELAVA